MTGSHGATAHSWTPHQRSFYTASLVGSTLLQCPGSQKRSQKLPALGYLTRVTLWHPGSARGRHKGQSEAWRSAKGTWNPAWNSTQ